jgi:hypothetical protein
MGYRYLLKADHQAEYDEVSKETWIRAERTAGFQPKMSSDHPEYMNVCATGGFGGSGMSGKIIHVPDERIRDQERRTSPYGDNNPPLSPMENKNV